MNARLLRKQITIILLTLASLVVLGIITTNMVMAQDKGKEEGIKKDQPITQEKSDKKLKDSHHKKLKGWHHKSKHHRKPMNPDAMKKKLDDAVKSGEITQQEADEKLKGLNNKPK